MASLSITVTDTADPERDRLGRTTMNITLATGVAAPDLQALAIRVATLAVDEIAKTTRPALAHGGPTEQFAAVGPGGGADGLGGSGGASGGPGNPAAGTGGGGGGGGGRGSRGGSGD